MGFRDFSNFSNFLFVLLSWEQGRGGSAVPVPRGAGVTPVTGAGDPQPWGARARPSGRDGPGGWGRVPGDGWGAQGGVRWGVRCPEWGVPAAVVRGGGAWGCRVGSGSSDQVWGLWDRELTGAAAALPRRKTPGGCPGRERWQRVLLPFSAEEMSRFSRARGWRWEGGTSVRHPQPPLPPPPSPQHPKSTRVPPQ